VKSLPTSFRSGVMPITAAYYVYVRQPVWKFLGCVAYVDVDLVEELHGVTEEHDRQDTPVNLSPKSFEVDILSQSFISALLRVLDILVCQVEIFIVTAIIHGGRRRRWGHSDISFFFWNLLRAGHIYWVEYSMEVSKKYLQGVRGNERGRRREGMQSS
jgi:hypothetical protein